jgi:hypothetical protein
VLEKVTFFDIFLVLDLNPNEKKNTFSKTSTRFFSIFFNFFNSYLRILIFFTGNKGLPQGSVLSPFLYNLLGSDMGKFVPLGCDFLQYCGLLVTPRASNCLCLGSDGLLVTQRFCSLLGLTISSTKSEVVWFSRKHLRPPVSIQIGDRLIDCCEF